jgi:hypothetical protein
MVCAAVEYGVLGKRGDFEPLIFERSIDKRDLRPPRR